MPMTDNEYFKRCFPHLKCQSCGGDFKCYEHHDHGPTETSSVQCIECLETRTIMFDNIGGDIIIKKGENSARPSEEEIKW